MKKKKKITQSNSNNVHIKIIICGNPCKMEFNRAAVPNESACVLLNHIYYLVTSSKYCEINLVPPLYSISINISLNNEQNQFDLIKMRIYKIKLN